MTEASAVYVYCLVPPDLREQFDTLSRHFRENPNVEVLVERRKGVERRSGVERRGGGDRRSGEDRRKGEARAPRGSRLSPEAGRRRRATLAPAEQRPPLPEAVTEYADRLAFVELREHRGAPAPTEEVRDQVEALEERAARAEAQFAEWRERCLTAESEVDELLRALVGAADDLRRLRGLSPRRFLAVRRAEHAIERHRRRRSSERGQGNP